MSNKNELHLVDFNYDGAGPDAYFMIVKEGNPRGEGIKLQDENGSCVFQMRLFSRLFFSQIDTNCGEKEKHRFILMGYYNTFRISLSRSGKLKGYRNKNVYLSLGSNDIRDVKWFYVFCIKANQLFGAVQVKNPLLPSEQKISDGIQGAHGVSTGPITLKDSRTMIIKDFSYDGAAPGTT